MKSFLPWLQRASYSKMRLIEMMLIILIVSMALTFVSSQRSGNSRSDVARFYDDVVNVEEVDLDQALERLLGREGFSFPDVIPLIPLMAEFEEPDMYRKVMAVMEASEFSILEKELFSKALLSWQDGESPHPDLVAMASNSPPPRYANRLLGDFYRDHGGADDAIKAYRKEGQFEEANVSRRRLVHLLIGQERFDEVTALREVPLYEDAFDPFILRDLAIQQRDFPELMRWFIHSQYAHVRLGLVAMAIFTGLLWFGLCLRLGQVEPLFSKRTLVCLLAMGLGILSAHATLLAVIIQDEWWGFTMQEELISGLVYCIAGIGLREEFLKLLFVLPLVPWLVKKGERLDWLIVPAFVGLGFAAEENLNYFHQSNSLAAPSRFLTANFFHITATALCGQALCRFWHRPRQKGDEFLVMFGFVVLIHGLYDALLILPDLQDYSLFAFTAFIFLCYQFFGELRPLRHGGDRYSLTSLFLLSISLLFGLTLVYLGTFLGIRYAILMVYPVIIEVAVLVYMFIREFREPIQ